ncbi:MAG: pyrroline-5-carboxylate reductase [Pusillimonas sp.]
MPADTMIFPRNQVITFVGGGQMATALIRGLLRSGFEANNIIVLEPLAMQRERVALSLGVRTLAMADEVVAKAGTVVWAVKPQVLQTAIQSVHDRVVGALHLSIVAGIATHTLSRWLESDRIVRAMPNTPSTIGAGVTGMLAMPGTSPADRQLAEIIFGATGYCFWVESDERIDAVTAVSGSGPGYVFEFLASFQRAAQTLGFSEEQARELVVRTALGAAQQAASEPAKLSALRDQVASKGGTTEAGLDALTRHHLPLALKFAVENAYGRARELSRTT